MSEGLPPERVDTTGELDRALSLGGLLALAVSDITPMASLLVIAPVVLGLAGTAGFWAYLIGCFIAINVAACMGELGSIYPVAGGQYSIVHRVLGGPLGFVALLDYLVQAVFLPASIVLGFGTYLHSLNHLFPVGLSSAVVMAIVTIVAVLRIRVNAVLVGIFLAIEVAVLAILALDGLTHLNQPLSIIFQPVAARGGELAPVATGAIIAALATALFSVNGYDSTLNFSEETRGPASHIGRAVVLAALTGILLEIVPFTADLFGAQNLKAYLASSTPLTDLVAHTWGPALAKVMIVGALFALFNAVLAITLQFARIVWSSARDRAWPQPVNEMLGRVHPRYHSPWVATLIMGTVATVLCFAASLVTAVTFTAVLIVTMYGLVAISALVSRVRDRHLRRPSKMWFWPVPPIIALAGVVIALTQQKPGDLLVLLALFVVGLGYYAVYLRRRSQRWVPHVDEEILEPQAAQNLEEE